MKKIKSLLILTAFTYISTLAFAQTEQPAYRTAADNFEKNYNDDNFDAIFASFSPEMQKALPIEKTKAFLTGLKQQAGKITKREFVKYEQNYAVYKTNFERALFAVNISTTNTSAINALLIRPFVDDNLPKPERNITKLTLPFKDEWFVVWGGDTKELNYHVESPAQKNAFDLLIKNEKGNTFKTNGKTNEDFYAFNKELFAPCDGTVVSVIDGIKDNEPGIFNSVHILGNSVIIQTANNEYLFFAHFKQNSIVVKQGQKVKQGQLLGHCGNSGRSSEPHLHFHIQNTQDMNVATGIKCYFDNIDVNGELKNDYSPIQNQRIKNH